MKKQNWTGEKKKLHLLILVVCLISVLLCSCSSGQNVLENSVEEPSTDVSALSSDDTSDTASMDNVDLSTIYNTQTFQYKGDIYFYDYHGIYRLNPKTSESELIYDNFYFGCGIVVHNDYIYFANSQRIARIDLNGENYIEFENDGFHGYYEALHLYGDILEADVADLNEDNTSAKQRTVFYDIRTDDTILKEIEAPDTSQINKMKQSILEAVLAANTDKYFEDVYNYSDSYIYIETSGDTTCLYRLNRKTGEIEDISKYDFFDVDIIDGWIYYKEYPGNDIVVMARIKEDLSETEIISEPTHLLSLEDIAAQEN